MKKLMGFKEYMQKNSKHSVFSEAITSGGDWVLNLQGYEVLEGRIIEDMQYQIELLLPIGEVEGSGKSRTLDKIRVKLIYPEETKKEVAKLIKMDKQVAKLGLAPIPEPTKRYHIKNKSLYPLMKEKEVVFFTLLEGEVVRGLIADFSRYEITVKLKGGLPVTILRHSVYDLRDKRGMCYLKVVQDKRKDWQRSPLMREVKC
jgi:sRNA-binding regulator protein Hfq